MRAAILALLAGCGGVAVKTAAPDRLDVVYVTGGIRQGSTIALRTPDGDEKVLVQPQPGVEISDLSFSPDGAELLYVARSESGERRILALGPGGSVWPITDPALDARAPRFSPDGGSIAFLGRSGTLLQLYVTGPSGERPRALPSDSASLNPPVWSPGSGSILLLSDTDALGGALLVIGARTGLVTMAEASPVSDATWLSDDSLLVAEPRRMVTLDRVGGGRAPFADWVARELTVAPGGDYLACLRYLPDAASVLEIRDLRTGTARSVPDPAAVLHAAWASDAPWLLAVDAEGDVEALPAEPGPARRLLSGRRVVEALFRPEMAR